MRSVPLISRVWENRQTFMLCVTVAALSACMMMEFMIWQFSLYDRVGPFNSEESADTASEAQSVTVLKPITQLDDTSNDGVESLRDLEENPLLTEVDLEFLITAKRVLMRRTMAARCAPPITDTDQGLRAAIELLQTFDNELKLRIREQDASKESMDAISKDLGDSR